MPFTRNIEVFVALILVAPLAACATSRSGADDAAADAGPGEHDSSVPDADAGQPDGPCAAGAAGVSCVFDLHDRVVDGCPVQALEDLEAALHSRSGELPLWHQGKALFVTYGGGAAVAGTFNGWDDTLIGTTRLCATDTWTVVLDVPSGHHSYKLVRDGNWFLDPENDAFAYDGFEGNPDGRNSVLNTYDSGVGHLVRPKDPLCSDALGDCRPLTVYLPPGYSSPDAVDRLYPTLFAHDGQNIYDDPDCCFGAPGWELNRILDSEIAAGEVDPMIVVGFDHGGEQRLSEYGGALQSSFMSFQIDTVQTTAIAAWRIDPTRLFTAGSSLGGLISYRLAYEYPGVYAGAASLSGSFFVGGGTDEAMSAIAQSAGVVDLALYLDHGGTAEDGNDNYGSNVALRSVLEGVGFSRLDSPNCESGSGNLCYFHDVGAGHNEAAWRNRAWRFLRFLAPGDPQ